MTNIRQFMNIINEAVRATDYDNRRQRKNDTGTPDMFKDYLPAKDKAEAAFPQQHGLSKELWHRLKKSKLTDGYHQELLNIAYDDWQVPPLKGSRYTQMVSSAKANYGPVLAFAVMVGKYNQQVTNGGHMQYMDNGYSDTHDDMMEAMVDLGIKDMSPEAAEVYNIMNDFTGAIGGGECGDCNGEGGWDNEEEEEYEDEDGNTETEYNSEWEDCHNCGGTGEDDRHPTVNDPTLDSRYYAVYEKFMKQLEEWFRNYFKRRT